MTALEQFIRLEAPGRWRETPEAPWQEVVVSFGNATLVLSTFQDQPITHWSLAALNTKPAPEGPMLYSPGPDSGEVLQISDPEMIEAIATVAASARIHAQPKPKRQRVLPVLTVFLLITAGLALWRGPDTLRAYALSLVSPEQAQVISDGIRDALPAPCSSPDGLAALRRLTAPLDVDVVIMPWTTPHLSALPDGTVILSSDAIETAASAAHITGLTAAGKALGPEQTPLGQWLLDRSIPDILRFLTSGEIKPQDTRRMARALESRTDSQAPIAPAITPASLTTDYDWVALQNICAR